jgi:hypothetical protein
MDRIDRNEIDRLVINEALRGLIDAGYGIGTYSFDKFENEIPDGCTRDPETAERVGHIHALCIRAYDGDEFAGEVLLAPNDDGLCVIEAFPDALREPIRGAIDLHERLRQSGIEGTLYNQIGLHHRVEKIVYPCADAYLTSLKGMDQQEFRDLLEDRLRDEFPNALIRIPNQRGSITAGMMRTRGLSVTQESAVLHEAIRVGVDLWDGNRSTIEGAQHAHEPTGPR